MPTAHAAIQAPFHRFWMIGASAEAGSGRSKKNASLAVHPESTTPETTNAAMLAKRRGLRGDDARRRVSVDATYRLFLVWVRFIPGDISAQKTNARVRQPYPDFGLLSRGDRGDLPHDDAAVTVRLMDAYPGSDSGSVSRSDPVPWPAPAPAPPAGYLDAVGGQPVLTVARQAYAVALEQSWPDPARLHHGGRRAGLLLDTARASIARFLEVPTADCFLGSSASDLLHACIGGLFAARTGAGAPTRIIVSEAESMAVLAAARSCPQAEVVTVPVTVTGAVDVDMLASILAQGAALVCVQV